MFWSLEEVVGEKEKKRVRVCVWRRKKEGGGEKEKKKEIWMKKIKEIRENKIKNEKLKLRNAITIFLQ